MPPTGPPLRGSDPPLSRPLPAGRGPLLASHPPGPGDPERPDQTLRRSARAVATGRSLLPGSGGTDSETPGLPPTMSRQPSRHRRGPRCSACCRSGSFQACSCWPVWCWLRPILRAVGAGPGCTGCTGFSPPLSSAPSGYWNRAAPPRAWGSSPCPVSLVPGLLGLLLGLLGDRRPRPPAARSAVRPIGIALAGLGILADPSLPLPLPLPPSPRNPGPVAERALLLHRGDPAPVGGQPPGRSVPAPPPPPRNPATPAQSPRGLASYNQGDPAPVGGQPPGRSVPAPPPPPRNPATPARSPRGLASYNQGDPTPVGGQPPGRSVPAPSTSQPPQPRPGRREGSPPTTKGTLPP